MASPSDFDPAPRAAQRARTIEAVAFGLVAALPVLPHLVLLLREGVPRFGLFGDFALLEHATRHVWSGETLLGPYSRFKWNHPGPLFFYLAAPFQAAFGTASTGLYVATCFVNAVAAAAIGACARFSLGRAHAFAALVVVLAWFSAFGNVSANPWNPLVIALPFVAFFVAAAIFARGTSAAVFPLVSFGAFVSQTHIATVTTVGATGAVALGAFLVGERRRSKNGAGLLRLERRDKRRLAGAALVTLLLFSPPLLEQCLQPTGNIRKIASFFLDRPAPLKPLLVAIQHYVTATSWLPDRLFSLALRDEGAIPLVMRWDAVPDYVTRTARTIAYVHGAVALACGVIATRRRDYASLALLSFGTLGSIAAVTALQAIIGPSYYYLVFWTTAASTVVWMGALSTLTAAAGSVIAKRRIGRLATAPVALSGLAVAAMVTSLQGAWLEKSPHPPASRPFEREALREVHGALRERVARDGTTPVIHPEGAWDMAHAIVLELEKEGDDVRVSERDRWNYMGVPSSEGVQAPLHVYFATTPLPLPCAGDLELIAKSGDIAMYGSKLEPASCEPR